MNCHDQLKIIAQEVATDYSNLASVVKHRAFLIMHSRNHKQNKLIKFASSLSFSRHAVKDAAKDCKRKLRSNLIFKYALMLFSLGMVFLMDVMESQLLKFENSKSTLHWIGKWMFSCQLKIVSAFKSLSFL